MGEFKWFAIALVGIMFGGAIGWGAEKFAESASVSACAAAGMEWIDGDCIRDGGRDRTQPRSRTMGTKNNPAEETGS